MTPLAIQLRYSHEPQREMCARLVAGGDSSDWLRVMASWGIPLGDMKLLVVPQSAQDVSPLGVVIVGEGIPASEHRSLPYGVVGSKLYVPIEATFSPTVGDSEWADLLSEDMAAYVWHPVVGLIGFEEEDIRRVSDLIEPPTINDDDWSRAEPGVTVNARLWSVAGPELPSADEVLGTGKGTIGTKVDKMGQLISGPMEKMSQGVSAAVGAAILPFAMLASKLASMMPKGGAGKSAGGTNSPGGIGEGWAARMLRKTADLLSARNRQIDKLLDMLHSNPDEGLKFAIPFGGSFGAAFRGLALPGFSLFARLVDFSLAGMGGGGGVDLWDIDPERQMRLINRYRELAEREIRLGRYRRAAYIYATLLNDLPSAASVLEKGKQYREAAVLYKEKLHRPWEAVRCLEQGGLFDEAVKLYEELEAYERIGDLYVRLEQPDEAEQAYQRAVGQFVTKDDYLAAAKLQEQKLHDVDAALTTLDAGWPRSAQARACLDESFRMLGRLGRHKAAQQRVNALGRQTLRDDRMPLLVDGLVEAAVGYPDVEVQLLAADVARVTTSRVLTRRRVNSKPLLDALRRLAPQDRLLDRDCHRFARTSKPKPVAKLTTSKQNPGGVLSFIPERIREYQLNKDVDWSKCQLTLRGFYVAGFRGKEIVLTRGGWNCRHFGHDSFVWPATCNSDRVILMTVTSLGHVYLDIGYLDFGETQSFERIRMSATDEFHNRSFAGRPGWLPHHPAGFSLTPFGRLWCVESDFKTLKVIDADGTPLATKELPGHEGFYDVDQWPPTEVLVYARDDGGLIGVGPGVIAVKSASVRMIDMSHKPVLSIVGAIPNSSRRAVALSDKRGLMLWDVLKEEKLTVFGHDHESPAATFMRDGRLVVVGDAGMSIYSTEKQELKLLAESSYAIPDALGACQLPGTQHLAVCRKSGVIEVLSLPEWRRD